MVKDLAALLEYIPVSSLDYGEWISIGMALKHEGYPCDVWDRWSAGDSPKRYHSGECREKWNTFNEGAVRLVTGGTIYEMATRYGYSPGREVRAFDWNDEIEYDGDKVITDAAWLDTSKAIEEPQAVGTDDLRRFIQALFKPDEIVGFCVDAELDAEHDKWRPSSKGSYGMTAKQILDSIKRYPADITETIGTYTREAGAWIRFNPLDGHGVKNSNVTDLRYALVESDDLEIERQKAIVEELNLPVAVMTYSGGKSVHSIIRVDAVSPEDYREKVDYVYRICEKNGLTIDKQNKNPSRLTRMPGVMRGDKKQFIIAENIGAKTFDEWKEYIEDLADTLPDIISFGDIKELPPLAPEIIKGVLRKGHKMLIAGSSKAGKSFLLIELAIAIATGKKWLDFECERGRVLYANLEVDGTSFLHRVAAVREGMKVKDKLHDLDIWNLRGENVAMDYLGPRLVRRAKNGKYAAIIIDPMYKTNQGEENSAKEMGMFFLHLDRICKELETSIICCHHHSKGAQGGKFVIDRASGSGVIARDPDALMDIIQLNPKNAEKSLPKGATAWRISTTLREFATPDGRDVIFEYPLHHITADLKDAKPMGGQDSRTNSERGNKAKQEKTEKRYERIRYVIENWDEIDPKVNKTLYPTVSELVEYFKSDDGFSENSIKRQIKNHGDYALDYGNIIPAQKDT